MSFKSSEHYILTLKYTLRYFLNACTTTLSYIFLAEESSTYKLTETFYFSISLTFSERLVLLFIISGTLSSFVPLYILSVIYTITISYWNFTDVLIIDLSPGIVFTKNTILFLKIELECPVVKDSIDGILVFRGNFLKIFTSTSWVIRTLYDVWF